MSVSSTNTLHVFEPPSMSVAGDEDRIRGNVYALLGNLLVGPPTRALLDLLAESTPEPGDESLLAASWQMLAVAAQRADVGALREWTADQVSLHSVDKVFELHELLTRAFKAQLDPDEAKFLELETAKVVFPLEVLRTLMAEMSIERRAGWPCRFGNLCWPGGCPAPGP